MLKFLLYSIFLFFAIYLQQGQPKLHIGEKDDIDGLTTSPSQHFVLLSLGQLVTIYTMNDR